MWFSRIAGNKWKLFLTDKQKSMRPILTVIVEGGNDLPQLLEALAEKTMEMAGDKDYRLDLSIGSPIN